MAAESVFASALGGSSTTIVLPGSAAIQAGDRRYFGTTGVFSVDLPAPTGWERIHKGPVAADASRNFFLFQKIAGASETASTTFTFTATTPWAGAQVAVRGADPTEPLDAVFVQGSGSGGTALVAPSITTQTADALVIGWFISMTEVSTATVTKPPQMTTLAGRNSGGSGTGQAIVLASEARPTAGATGTRTATASVNFRWTAGMLAVRPAPAAVPTPPGAWLPFFA